MNTAKWADSPAPTFISLSRSQRTGGRGGDYFCCRSDARPLRVFPPSFLYWDGEGGRGRKKPWCGDVYIARVWITGAADAGAAWLARIQLISPSFDIEGGIFFFSFFPSCFSLLCFASFSPAARVAKIMLRKSRGPARRQTAADLVIGKLISRTKKAARE